MAEKKNKPDSSRKSPKARPRSAQEPDDSPSERPEPLIEPLQLAFDSFLEPEDESDQPPEGGVVPFVGRDHELDTLHALLRTHDRVLLTNADGLPDGARPGKTALALDYLESFEDDYPGGVYIFSVSLNGCAARALRSDDRAGFDRFLARSLAVRLVHDVDLMHLCETASPEIIASTTTTAVTDDGLSLFILDGIESDEHWKSVLRTKIFPVRKCKFLVVSRDPSVSIKPRLELGPPSEPAAESMLAEIRPGALSETDTAAIRDIARALHYDPSALIAAGCAAYFKPDRSWSAIATAIIPHGRADDPARDDFPAAARRAATLLYNSLPERHKSLVDNHPGIPEPGVDRDFPWQMTYQRRKHALILSDPDPSDFQLQSHLRSLRKEIDLDQEVQFKLLDLYIFDTPGDSEDCIILHPGLADLRAQLLSDNPERLKDLLDTLCESMAMLLDDYEDPTEPLPSPDALTSFRLLCEFLLHHGRTRDAAEFSIRIQPVFGTIHNSEEAALLLHEIIDHLTALADNPFFLGPSYNALALARKYSGQHAAALDAFAKALKVFDDGREDNKGALFRCRMNRGNCYADMQDSASAVDDLEFALAIRDALPPEDWKLLAKCLSDLAVCRADRGEYADARSRMRESVNLFDKNLERGDPDRLEAHRRFGELLTRLNDHTEAAREAMTALKLSRITYGSKSIEVAHYQYIVAQCFFTAGDDASALEHSEESVRLVDDIPDPPVEAVAECNELYALLLLSAGRLDEALIRFRIGLAAYEEFLLPDDPKLKDFRDIITKITTGKSPRTKTAPPRGKAAAPRTGTAAPRPDAPRKNPFFPPAPPKKKKRRR